jgi:tetratricopeptide (TPR) repeat protein
MNQNVEYLKLLEKGGKARLEEDYSLALDCFTKCIQVNPHLFEAYIERGVCYQLRNEQVDAIRNYNIAFNFADSCLLDNGSDTAVLHYKYIVKGLIYEMNNQWEDALEEYKLANKTHTAFYGPFSIAFVQCSMAENDPANKLDYFRESIKYFDIAEARLLKDNNYEYFKFYFSIIITNTSWMYFQLENQPKAMELYTQALQLNPNHIVARYSRSSYFRAVSLMEEARIDLNYCINLFRQRRSTIELKLQNCNNKNDSIELLNSYKRTRSRLSRFQEDLAFTHFGTNKSKAKELFTEAIQVCPTESAYAYYILAFIVANWEGNYALAIHHLNTGIEQCSRSVQIEDLKLLFEFQSKIYERINDDKMKNQLMTASITAKNMWRFE